MSAPDLFRVTFRHDHIRGSFTSHSLEDAEAVAKAYRASGFDVSDPQPVGRDVPEGLNPFPQKLQADAA